MLIRSKVIKNLFIPEFFNPFKYFFTLLAAEFLFSRSRPVGFRRFGPLRVEIVPNGLAVGPSLSLDYRSRWPSSDRSKKLLPGFWVFCAVFR
jgi:hypothetical protein